ncbi:MAG: AAA family ATPase [Desulfobacteraceae bacterium]
MMNRDIYKILMQWKAELNRRPLLIRGARQVGKTFLVRYFGKEEFEDYIELNFEKNPEYKDIFTSIDPVEIVEKIALFTQLKVNLGKTLLFLDEIQDCPAAITSLRYFFEEMPELHIIAAGSLVEFTINAENFRMPVGRIQYLYMFPLSFGEFLDAMGERVLRIHTHNKDELQKLPDSLHLRLLDYVRKFFFLGGMPAVLQEYCLSRNIEKCQRIQRSIVDTYIDDFGKYAKKIKHKYLRKVFYAAPRMIGQKFVYANVDNTIKSRELKEAVELLEMAGVVVRTKSTSGAGIPLEAGAKENYFKALFLDVGLMHAMNNIYGETARAKDFTNIFKGAVAEQFVGQQLLAYQSPYTKPSLYYWTRDARNSMAEIDYLMVKDENIIPVEIKSGATGHMKSMHIFIKTFNSDLGLKISQANYDMDVRNRILSIPFYSIEGIINGDLIEK